MKTDELFGVGVRWIGLVCAMLALPELLQLDYMAAVQAAGQGVAGLILMTRADWIVRLCYPKDFREPVIPH